MTHCAQRLIRWHRVHANYILCVTSGQGYGRWLTINAEREGGKYPLREGKSPVETLKGF